MKKFLTLAVALLAAPLVAQTTQGMDHSKMDMSKPGAMNTMDHSKMDHSKIDKMDHSKMEKMDHSKMDHAKMCDMGAMMKNTAANPYAEDSMAMHKRMMTAMGSDAAETWTRQMIEHHRGAIAMSKTATANVTDKQTLAMARKGSAAQTKEIADLQMWLKQNGKSAQ